MGPSLSSFSIKWQISFLFSLRLHLVWLFWHDCFPSEKLSDEREMANAFCLISFLLPNSAVSLSSSFLPSFLHRSSQIPITTCLPGWDHFLLVRSCYSNWELLGLSWRGVAWCSVNCLAINKPTKPFKVESFEIGKFWRALDQVLRCLCGWRINQIV